MAQREKTLVFSLAIPRPRIRGFLAPCRGMIIARSAMFESGKWLQNKKEDSTFLLMPADKLSFGLVLHEAAIVSLLLVYRLLLLRYVFVVCHNICFAIIAHASASLTMTNPTEQTLDCAKVQKKSHIRKCMQDFLYRDANFSSRPDTLPRSSW